MKKDKIKKIFSLAAVIVLAVIPVIVFAATADVGGNFRKIGDSAGYETVNEKTASSIVGNVIKVGLSLLGVIFVVLVIYAGYNWMTASGDETKIEKAKDTLWRSIIGLIITVSAYAIWAFIFNNFLAVN